MVTGGRPRLSAYLYSHSKSTWESHVYRHKPKPDTCALCGVPAPPLERAVIEALYELAGDEEVRGAWMDNGRGDGQTTVGDLTQFETANIEAKLHNRRHRHADLLRRFVDDDAAEGDSLTQYSELARALEIDIRRLEQRLTRAQRKDRTRPDTRDAETLEHRLRRELSVIPPLGDPAALRRRVEILQACVAKVVVHDDDDTGEIKVEIFGAARSSDGPPRHVSTWRQSRYRRTDWQDSACRSVFAVVAYAAVAGRDPGPTAGDARVVGTGREAGSRCVSAGPDIPLRARFSLPLDRSPRGT